MGRYVLAALATLGTLASADPPLPVSHQIAGAIGEHTVARGETLTSIGARAGVDAATLASINCLRINATLKPGHTLLLDTRHLVPVARGPIVINIPQRMLFLETGDEPLAFPAALGRPSWPTPIGTFTVLAKKTDPTWHVPTSIQHEMQRGGRRPMRTVPPGPDNPLGDRWCGLSLPGIGIHGTNVPASIYHLQTHGCIRLHPDDIRRVFDRVSVGTAGEIVYQPVLLGEIDGRVYLESHRDSYHRWRDPTTRVRASAAASGQTAVIDWGLVAAAIRESAGVVRDVTLTR